MAEMKECIMCCSEIDARAKKCPNCCALQSKFSNLEGNPVMTGIFLLFFIGFFGYFFYENTYKEDAKEVAVRELGISDLEVSAKIEANTLYVACMGMITNKTEFRMEGVKYEASFFNEQNVLIDTITVEDEVISIDSNGSANFRVRGVGQKDAALYKSCQVKILDAYAR